MQLSSLGYGPHLEASMAALRAERGEPRLEPARVVAEHRGAYQLIAEAGPCVAELTGKLRHEASSRLALPGVGDWVALGPDGRIEAVLPRSSVFVRKQAGHRPEPQIVAANIDYAFIVTSANADFNPRRLERYLAAVAESGARAVIVVNKADLCPDVETLVASLGPVAAGVPVARVSAIERRGIEQLEPYLGGTTIALVGSSGVGKSTIVNWLLARDVQSTAPIREHDDRGRHTTTHRELLPLPGGGALIDTPGMRELALWADDDDPLSESFEDIVALGTQCRFVDCQHHGQPGCAIQLAVAEGRLDPARLAHYEKLQEELAHNVRRGTPAERQANRRTGRARAKALRQRGPGRNKP